MSHLWLAGAPEPWHDCGFRVDPNGAITVGRTTLIPDGSHSGSLRWAFDPTTGREDIDGIAVVAPPASELARSGDRSPSGDPTGTRGATGGVTHPNGIMSIDHVVIATDDCSRTTAAFEDAGFPVRRTITTERFGVPLLQRFFWAGDVLVELIGPPDPTSDPATAGRSGHRAKLFGITFVTADMEHTVSALGPMIGPPAPAVQPDRSIATLRTREIGIRTRVAVMTRHVPDRS